MRLRSIRARMTVAFAVTISLLMLLACGALISYAQHAAERKADALLAATMLKIENDLADTALRIDPGDMQDNVKVGSMTLRILDASGQTLFRSKEDGPAWPLQADSKWYVKVERFRTNTLILGMPWRETQ